jgi:metallo-beta-lactamase class B
VIRTYTLLAAALLLVPLTASAQKADAPCPLCATWNAPQDPFHVYGNTYYVGTHGLSALLIVSKAGLVLIDGDLPDAPPQIAAHIKALGFDIRDVKLILNTHAHFDHAGGISALQTMSGATVDASPWSAAVFKSGGVGKDDPQYGAVRPIAPVAHVRVIHDGEVVHLGDVALTAHFTPGHTPGGTSWTWKSCEKGRCRDMVYTDSLTGASADGYKFSAHPAVVASFEKSFQTVDALPCDILLTPHPEFSDVMGRMQKGDFVDPQACHMLVAKARDAFAKRLESEKTRK